MTVEKHHWRPPIIEALDTVLATLPYTSIFVRLFAAQAFITMSMCALVCSVSLILYAQWEKSTSPSSGSGG